MVTMRWVAARPIADQVWRTLLPKLRSSSTTQTGLVVRYLCNESKHSAGPERTRVTSGYSQPSIIGDERFLCHVAGVGRGR
jgi:hypothetical protein